MNRHRAAIAVGCLLVLGALGCERRARHGAVDSKVDETPDWPCLHVESCERKCAAGDGRACVTPLFIGPAKDDATKNELFRRGCAAGYAGACGMMDPPDRERQAALAQAGCDRGDAASCWEIKVALDIPFEGRKPYLVLACDAGDASSCDALASDRLVPDPEASHRRAVTLHEKGCAAGSPRHCSHLGRYQEAADLYERECLLDMSSSCDSAASIAKRHLNDKARARRLYKRACALGYPGTCDPD